MRLFASLDSTNDGCRLSNVPPGAAGAETRFFVTLMLGNTIVLDNAVTNSIAMQESYLERLTNLLLMLAMSMSQWPRET